MPENPTERLAEFAAALQYDDIPVPVRDYTKVILLDALACAFAGHLGEETRQVAALASGIAQSDESSVIGGGRLSLAGATLLNGYLMTAVTMCDVHTPTFTHVTPEVVPPALLIGERDDLSGRDLLTAIAAGCEVTTRVGIGLDFEAFRARGFHGPGVIGPFGSAAATGRLLGFDGETMARAFGLAGSQSAGTFAAWGTPTVKFHQCRGALSGLLAALLAQQKFVATREILTAKDGGLFNSYGNGGKPDLVTADLGQRWELVQIGLRIWPSAASIQGVITAMVDLIEGERVAPEQVARVRVAVGKNTFALHGGFDRYKGKFEALLSGHYVIAVILHDRRLSLAQFEPARYDDPVLKAFAADKVEVRLDPTLTAAQAVIEIERTDGTKAMARCEHPRGSPERPLSRAQVEEKFRTYAQPLLSKAAMEDVVGMVMQIESLRSARRLMEIMRRRSAPVS